MLKKTLKFITIFIMLFVLFAVSFQRFYIPIKQKYSNNKILKNKSQYTIMCLGESTTAGQYPIQLQRILNEQYPNKFSVVDCGFLGANLETIFSSLESNINKYKPNIVICMMGVTNGFVSQDNSLRIPYELRDERIDKAIMLKQQKQYSEAIKVLEDILKEQPNNENAIIELMDLMYNYTDNQKFVYEMAIKNINKKDINVANKALIYKIIFEYNLKIKDPEALKFYINQSIEKDSDIFTVVDMNHNLYGYIRNYITNKQREKILSIIGKVTVFIDKNYGLLAIESIRNKNYQEAEEYFKKAEESRLNSPNIETYNQYKLILKKLTDNNIKVICMQYPLRSINSLQEQLKNEPYYNKLTFISNEQLFKEALMNKSYDEIFKDQVGGDFGHCTDLGNILISKNIINVLDEILN